jgi:hypothetical protein
VNRSDYPKGKNKKFEETHTSSQPIRSILNSSRILVLCLVQIIIEP